MKPRKKPKILIYIFFFLLCFKSTKSTDCVNDCTSSNGISCIDSSSQSCDPTCKPNYGTIGHCYDCAGITGNYYTINSDGICLNQCLGDKIIGDTGECTYEELSLSNTDVKKLGDIYYFSGDIYNSLTACVSNDCSCTSFYSLETINGKKIYTCFDNLNTAQTKGYTYYHYQTSEFFKSGCPNGFNFKKAIESPSVTRCSDKCIGSEFLITIVDTSGIVNNYCVDSCGDASYEDYKYEYIDNGIKKCLDECPSGTYIKDLVCVTKDQCNFYEETSKKCYSSCPNSDDLRKPYNSYGNKECISACTYLDYIYEKNPTNYICYRKEDCNFVKESSDSTPSKICLDSCEANGEFHDYDSKLCTDSCGSDDTNKIYYANNGHVCYSSCTEIPGGYLYEDDSNICYKENEKPDCEAFYKKNNGILKCTTISDCVSNLHKIYLLGDECKDNCNGYYQFETSSSEVHYIKCFDTLTEALSDDNVKFYDATQKKCWKNFPNKNTYFIKSSFTDSDTNYEVVNECDYFYNEIEDPTDNTKTCYQCVDNCKTINKYFEIGSKKCENSCNKFNKYYYDASNNECLPSCDSRPNKPFSIPLTIEDVNTLPTPKECLTSCDSTSNNKYYNYNSNICITSCGTDDSSNLYYKRTTSTDTTHKNKCFPSCKDIPGGNYKYELSDNSCTNTEITTFPSTDSITHVQYDFYYRKNDGVIKYVATSDCQNLNYIYIEGNECKRNCNNNYYKLEVEIDSNTFIKCFSEPSGCLTGRTNSDNKIYYRKRHPNPPPCENFFFLEGGI